MEHDLTILVVEDDAFSRRLIGLMLEKLGYHSVVYAVSGSEAVDMALQGNPGLILMDILLGGDMDGIEAAREIGRHASIPVVFLTGLTDSETLERAQDVNPFGYLVKPLDTVRLQSAIEIALTRERHEEILRRSERRYRLLFDGMLNAFALFETVFGEDGKIADLRFLEVNPAFERITDLARKGVLGKGLHEVLPGIEPVWIENLGLVALTGTPSYFESYSQDLNLYFTVRAHCPEPGQVAAVFEDVTGQKKAEQALAHRNFHDPLTGLPNRTLCLERVGLALERSKRRSNHIFAVMFVDLDRFRLVNDSLGHAAGDKLLRRVAEALKSLLRGLDTVGRLSGDEFVIVLEEIRYASEVVIVCRRIKDFFQKPLYIDGHPVFVSVSMGFVIGPGEFERAEDMLRNANLAANAAQRSGGNRFKIFKPAMLEEAKLNLDAETSLRLAIENQEFTLYYQPIVSLQNLRLVGFEALVRWIRDGEVVPPYSFIPLAEETGLIIPIGEFVLTQACAQIAAWTAKYPDSGLKSVAVNLSGKQFLKAGLVKMVARSLETTKAGPDMLKLEITESAIMEDPRSAILKLNGLRDLGLKLSIDDFGTGYSSLSQLIRFPVHTLKVDRSFVKDLDLAGNLAVTKTIISLAHNLGHDVVAEGIETREQLATLADLECENGQGYLFAKPLPPEDAEKLLAAPTTFTVPEV